MGYPLAFVLVAVLLAGCADDIQVKDGFGTSALKPVGDIPPEFAEFNNYDPSVNALLADQICARPYIHFDEKNLPAQPGELSAWRGRCKPYVITVETLPDTLLDP
jgi:hypothetical protein